MKHFALALLLTAPLLAQPTTQATSQPTTESVTADNYLLTISLHNQRLDAVAKQIEQASGANIVLSAPGVRPEELPMIQSLELRDVGIRQALETLTEIAPPPQITLSQPPTANNAWRQKQRDVFVLHVAHASDDAKPIMIGEASEPAQAGPPVVRVYSLTPYIFSNANATELKNLQEAQATLFKADDELKASIATFEKAHPDDNPGANQDAQAKAGLFQDFTDLDDRLTGARIAAIKSKACAVNDASPQAQAAQSNEALLQKQYEKDLDQARQVDAVAAQRTQNERDWLRFSSVLKAVSDRIDELQSDAVGRRRTDEVLQLIQAALSASNNPAATLKLYPPTNSLIVRGDADQQAAVESALTALK